MKSLGVQQFLQKKFKLLGIDGEWRGLLGELPDAFTGIIYGASGNGKTELCIRLAKYFTLFEKAAWLSYEQGHGYDLQRAIVRNDMMLCNGKFTVIDPMKKMKPGMTIFQELDKYLGKRGTPRFIFIDSLDYTRITFEQYDALKQKYGHKKAIIWISHAEGKKPKSAVGRDIEYDGGFGILVSKFIATPIKSRFGAIEDYIIWEERARAMNPLYFEKLAVQPDNQKLKTRRPKNQPKKDTAE